MILLSAMNSKSWPCHFFCVLPSCLCMLTLLSHSSLSALSWKLYIYSVVESVAVYIYRKLLQHEDPSKVKAFPYTRLNTMVSISEIVLERFCLTHCCVEASTLRQNSRPRRAPESDFFFFMGVFGAGAATHPGDS